MTRKQLEVGLAHSSIKKWAWIEHDKDVREDGSPVSVHVHVAIQCQDARSRYQIACWFGVPVSLVEPLGGRGAFISYVRYLTHEDPNQRALGKYRYPDNEVVANFDWRSEVDTHFVHAKEKPRKALDQVMLALLSGESSLEQVREEEPLLYAKNLPRLRALSEDYDHARRLAEYRLTRGINGPNVTLTHALSWIADRLGIEGTTQDRLRRAGDAVMGEQNLLTRRDPDPSESPL